MNIMAERRELSIFEGVRNVQVQPATSICLEEKPSVAEQLIQLRKSRGADAAKLNHGLQLRV